MACNSTEDKGASIFAASDAHDSTFDTFFDLGSDFPQLETSSANVTNGSFSSSRTPLGDFGHGISFQDEDFYQPTILPSRAYGPNLILATPVQFVTRLQRLNHCRHQESIVISGAQLMALENKDTSQIPVTVARHTYPIRMVSPHTPPTTPQHGRVKFERPAREETVCDSSQASKDSNLFQTPFISSKRLESQQTMASTTPETQKRDLSASNAQWTERLRSLAMQSPVVAQAQPISPPSSTKVEQSESSRGTSDVALLDTTDDIPEPFSSAVTATSSSNSKNPFWDDSSSSTMASSPCNLDAPVKLFELKDNTWDTARLESDYLTHERKANILNHQEHVLEYRSSPREDAHSTSSSSIGLGVFFGNDDLDDNLLGLSHHSPRISFDHVCHDAKPAVLPAVPFHTPVVKACASELITTTKPPAANTTIATTATVSSPASTKLTTTPRNHRRTKSAPSLQTSSRIARPLKPRDSSATTNLYFLNFTPDDRTRILTGVAPSGSSKTKARREKEAQERRKKLSEAARRLVLEAGGDVDAVERELSD